jgi:hypothetical protein
MAPDPRSVFDVTGRVVLIQRRAPQVAAAEARHSPA